MVPALVAWLWLASPFAVPHPVHRRQALLYPRENRSLSHLPVFGDSVIFPTDDPEPLLERPPCSVVEYGSFCQDVPEYPVVDVRQAISKSSPELKEVFTNVGLHGRTKIGEDDLGEERVCATKSKLFFPKAGLNVENKWRFIINDLEYSQTVVAEVCNDDSKPCSYLDNALPLGFKSRCRQMFSLQRLVALDETNKLTTVDTFRFPSCCVCYVKYPSLLTRSKSA